MRHLEYHPSEFLGRSLPPIVKATETFLRVADKRLLSDASDGNHNVEKSCVGRPHGSALDQAQEKPDLLEQPDKAPAGIDVRPDEILKLEAEMVFLTLPLPHLLHLISVSLAEELVNISKFALQSLHLYS